MRDTAVVAPVTPPRSSSFTTRVRCRRITPRQGLGLTRTILIDGRGPLSLTDRRRCVLPAHWSIRSRRMGAPTGRNITRSVRGYLVPPTQFRGSSRRSPKDRPALSRTMSRRYCLSRAGARPNFEGIPPPSETRTWISPVHVRLCLRERGDLRPEDPPIADDGRS